jgi:hypothetical protein
MKPRLSTSLSIRWALVVLSAELLDRQMPHRSAMKSLKICLVWPALVMALIWGAPLYAQSTNQIPSELRQGEVSCDKATIQAALELKRAGCDYVMPEPKSPQARWGNRDGRTTWWIGYWQNKKAHLMSSKQPAKDEKREWIADGLGGPAWRRGGSPPRPSKIQWLCSESGGIAPR